MFVDVVRRLPETLPADRRDLAAGLRDPFIDARCGAPSQPLSCLGRSNRWRGTWDSPCQPVRNASRQFVGRPPMQYLTNWGCSSPPTTC